MGSVKYNKVEYEKVNTNIEKNFGTLEPYFKECSKNYHNFLASYFVTKGGVLTDEFRFINA